MAKFVAKSLCPKRATWGCSCQTVEHFAQLCLNGGNDFMQNFYIQRNKNGQFKN